VTACAPQGGQTGPVTQAPTPTAPKRITGVIFGEPASLHVALSPPQSGPGSISALVGGSLTVADNQGVRRATVADAVPSDENGLWRVLPDGRMETTWRLRPGAQWHDGQPLTSADLLFTTRVERDPELPEFRSAAYDSVESVEALDAQQVLVRWKRPYVWADKMFGGTTDNGGGNTIPAHLLEQTYQTSKGSFRELPYWTDPDTFVGFGPFKLREWVRGSHMLLEANDRYVAGRPKIDAIEIRFVFDDQTLMANLLANAVDVTLSTNLAIEQAVEMRDRWGGGRMLLENSSWIALYPQFINPTPPVVADLRFRRALLHAIDRQAMVDTIQGGLVPVAHSFVSPNDAEFRDTESAAVRYDYDPRRAAELLTEIGYARGADGAFRDQDGERLGLEARTTANPSIHTRAFFPVVDYLQQLGLGIDPVVIPAQRVNDLEYRTQQPSFELIRYPNGAENLYRLHSSQTPLPDNKYTGRNRSRYVNPAFDALIDRYHTTIPWPERTQVMRDIVHYISDQLLVMGLFYDARAYFISNRMQKVYGGSLTWNAEEWDVQ
jgi:peptide/nickel transport system substrate-binding protein